jgi:hypothetical protein
MIPCYAILALLKVSLLVVKVLVLLTEKLLTV